MDLLTLGQAFIEGLALIVSPCILPILPLVLTASLDRDRGRPFGVIAGFVITFSLFALLSRNVVTMLGLDIDIIRNVSYALLIVFGLVLIFTPLSEAFARLTGKISELGNRMSVNFQEQSYGGFTGGLLLGACIGLIWTPCAGPILAAVIVQTVLQETTLGSFLTILAFALGVGLPMLLITLFSQRLASSLDWFKRHGRIIRRVMGAVIILTVVLTMQGGVLPPEKEAAVRAIPEDAGLIDPLPAPYPAPEIEGIAAWINSDPLTIGELRGKVVLIDFWTYSCINCIRTLPHLSRWHDAYAAHGLVIVGVHSPEFRFEKSLTNVRNAVEKNGIRYPVALDNDFKTWRNYENRYWPAHYLIDPEGNVVYTHFGEGRYAETEHNIRHLLGLTGRAEAAPGKEPFGKAGFWQTPETYLGHQRLKNFRGPVAVTPDKPVNYAYPDYLPLHHWSLRGQWRVEAERIAALETGAALRLNFRAKQVFLVMGSTRKEPVEVRILLNDREIRRLTVAHHALYELVDLPAAKNGLLEVVAVSPGLEAYAFTFGS